MKRIANYKVIEKIGETRNSIVYRAKGEGERESKTVVIKEFRTRYPSATDIARFNQEYGIIRGINLDGVIKALDLVTEDGIFHLVIEDFDGISLKELIRNEEISVESFLEIAIKTADTLGKLHVENIIHKDIKPSNILINSKTGEVKITDFGISRVLTREDEDIYNREVVEGTLLYMSPEQTGRINRTVDYRTDLYSLGITFYEIVTGALPFESDDPMEVMHSHIAIMAPSPHDLESHIPEMISRIIMKLMLKTPEERYQTGFGLKFDLEECLRQLEKSASIEPFELGVRDIANRFIIPQMLVGREKDIDTLLFGFEKASQGSREFLVVKGAPGIGKSALINEVHKPIVAKRGYYISGKYEQFTRDRPYSAIIQAFEGLIKKLLMESDERINKWKEDILEAVGRNGGIITEIIPELELIIGRQRDVQEVTPKESRDRFNLVFENFVKVFLKEEHPISLFLDDLQWSDLASLEFLKRLATSTEIKYLYIVCSYRDNEVDQNHPAALTIREIERRDVAVSNITLGPLKERDVQALILNFMRCEEDEASTLANLVHQKTGGNPFFINQFLQTIYSKKLIKIDPYSGWSLDLENIGKTKVTDNIVELMVEKISALPLDALAIVKVCSAIGNRFALHDLAYLMDIPIEKALSDLTIAIENGYVDYDREMSLYVFHHDRIQEAAYSLIPEDEKPGLHYRIGRLAMENSKESGFQNMLFSIADHLNLGAKIVAEKNENIEVAGLNHEAGRKAKLSAAYSPAMKYLDAGISLLNEDAWENEYELILSLLTQSVEVSCLLGDYDRMESLSETSLGNAKTLLDKVTIYTVKITAAIARENLDSALNDARQVGKLLGRMQKGNIFRILIQFIKLKLALIWKSDKKILSLPDMTHPIELAALEYGSALGYLLLNLVPNTFALYILKNVHGSLKYGLAPHHAHNYATFASILIAGFNDIDGGYRYGKLALELADREFSRRYRSITLCAYNTIVRHWKEPLRNSIEPFMEGYKLGLENGDLFYAAFNLNLHTIYSYVAGYELTELLKVVEDHRNSIINLNQLHWLNEQNILWQVLLNLTDVGDSRTKLTGKAMDEDIMVPQWEAANNKIVLAAFFSNKNTLCVLHHEYSEALKCVDEVETYLESVAGSVIIRNVAFYGSIAKLALCPEASSRDRRKYFKWANKHHKLLRKWAKYSPENNLHRYHLIKAEMARVQRKNETAETHYDLAITLSRDHQYLHEEAFANELAARYYLSIGKKRMASLYLRDAYNCYYRWGAISKLKQLKELYPGLLETTERTSISPPDAQSGSSTGSRTTKSVVIDVSTVKKVHEAIAGEFHLDKVLEKIMNVTFENAGAQRGFLLLRKGDDFCIFAKGTANEEIAIGEEAIDESHELSRSIINYVLRTGSRVILDNACRQGEYTGDSHIAKNGVKSLFCIPIVYQKNIIGSLYMENNLTTAAFTEERLEVLNLIIPEAAIAIKNAQSVEQDKKNAVLKEEIEHARRIQTGLTPTEPKIDGYEITGYMETADDVGGDYYDVINANGIDWLVIGDVSGHGLGAGLIMMMVQTAIRVTLEKNPQISPSGLLSSINGAITGNINKLGEGKYMTITVFALRDVGKFEFAGQHQDIFVYREKTGTVERFETNGMWLGIVDDIEEMLEDGTLSLDIGDVILLYTDGITEAWRKGRDASKFSEADMYGEERLQAAFARLASGTTEVIKNGIIEELKAYSCPDDVSMLVLKRIS